MQETVRYQIKWQCRQKEMYYRAIYEGKPGKKNLLSGGGWSEVQGPERRGE